MAAAIGINLATETPAATVDVMGIGNSGTQTFNGYQVDELVVPLTGGNQMVFHDIIVFVPNAGALPANLPGIFGMNLISQSFSGQDPNTGDFLNPTSSPFNDWYVVPPSTLPGDANGDGKVDINDLNALLAHYDQTGMTLADGDFNGDGRVDINDLSILLANYDTKRGRLGRRGRGARAFHLRPSRRRRRGPAGGYSSESRNRSSLSRRWAAMPSSFSSPCACRRRATGRRGPVRA